jgi:hypothetical protein
MSCRRGQIVHPTPTVCSLNRDDQSPYDQSRDSVCVVRRK